MPPEWMWAIPDELDEWFDEVAARYSSGRINDDDEDAPDMVQNELAH